MSASELTNFDTGSDEMEEVPQAILNKIDQLSYEDPSLTPADKALIEHMAHLKHREILSETLSEYSWRGNFIWIFPSLGTNKYD